jgi:hypothetical protein
MTEMVEIERGRVAERGTGTSDVFVSDGLNEIARCSESLT